MMLCGGQNVLLKPRERRASISTFALVPIASAPQTTPDKDFGVIDRYVQNQEVRSDLTHLFDLIVKVDD